MDPSGRLLWGLTVWFAISSLCYAASYKGQLYSQNGVSHESTPQTSPLANQDTASTNLEQDKDGQVKIIGAIPIYPESSSETESEVDAEHSPTPGDVVAPDNSSSTDDVQLSTPQIAEEGIEEEDENGVIRGKFAYVEEDGVPAQIEYEAIPGLKFEVKTYQKGSKVLPPPNFDESPESGRALRENNYLNPIECRKSIEEGSIGDITNNGYFKATSSGSLENYPEYEHASVIGRHDLKPNERKTRSINNKFYKSEEGLVNEPNDENSEIEKDNDEPPVDASYRFGFSADGQTRHEEADAQGNVQGSYSYIGEDGIMTRVEYEAGSGKGFIVKRVIHEDTRKSLHAKPSQDQTELDKNSDIESESQFPKLSIENKKQETPHVPPTVVNTKQNGEEETENEDKIKVNHNDDNTYSLYYAIPNQWISASKNLKENTLQVNNDGSYSYSYMIPDQYHVEAAQEKKYHFSSPKDTKITQDESKESSKVEDVTSQTANPTVDKSSPQIQNDGSYSYSYETEDQLRHEAGDVDGNVQGKYSYIGDDGVRRTVHYKASPTTGFSAEGSHLPVVENKREESNVQKVYESDSSFKGPSSQENLPVKSSSNNGKPSTAEYIPPVDGDVNLDSNSENQYILHGIKTYSTQKINGAKGSDDPTQVFPDLQGITGVYATEDGQIHKYKKVIKKRPIHTATPENTPSNAAYNFEYELENQNRKELVDTQGNVYSTYQFNTKDGGRTNFLFVRKTGENLENKETTGAAAKRHIPDYINEDNSSLNSNVHPSGRIRNSRKRQVQSFPDPNINHYNLADHDVQIKRDRGIPPQYNYVYQNRKALSQPPKPQERADNINYRRAKSISKPFRGYIKYH